MAALLIFVISKTDYKTVSEGLFLSFSMSIEFDLETVALNFEPQI